MSPSSELLSLLERATLKWPNQYLSFRDDPCQDSAQLSFKSLLEQAKTNANKLLSLGIVTARVPVLLYFEDFQESVVWFWSVVASGAIPAALAPLAFKDIKTRLEDLQRVGQLFANPVVLTCATHYNIFHGCAHLKVISIDDLRQDNNHATVSDQQHQHFVSGCTDTAAILFTSGSSGPSKAVEYSHSQLLTSSRIKCEANNTGESDVFLCWTCARQIMVPGIRMTKDPMTFWKTLSEDKISYTFAPNSYLAAAMLCYDDCLEKALLNLNFSSLRTLFCGGEANKTSTLAKAASFLTLYGAPQNAVTAVYGLSETCSALFYNRYGPEYDVAQGYKFASVGKILPGNELRVVDLDNLSVQGGLGAIQLRGPLISRSYWNNPQASISCRTGNGWFNTGDLGSIDGHGNLCISGRIKETLVINGQNISSGELEYAIETNKGVETGFTACFSVWVDNSHSEEIVVLFNTSDALSSHEVVHKVQKSVIARTGKRAYRILPLPKECLPKSTIGKLSRNKLKESFLSGDFDQYKELHIAKASEDRYSFENETQRALAEILAANLGHPDFEVTPDTALQSLGIDSLGYLRLRSHIQRSLRLDRPLPLEQLLSCRNIKDIESSLTQANDCPVYNGVKVLQSCGSNTPLILCHPANGNALMDMVLLPFFTDRKVLALHARGFEPTEDPFDSMEEMLETYLAGIRQEQPKGPYALLGTCFGGVLAFELAKRLEAGGDEIIFCGGIEAPPEMSLLVGARHESFTIMNETRHILSHILLYSKVLDVDEVESFQAKVMAVPESSLADQAYSMFQDQLIDLGLSPLMLRMWLRVSISTYQIASQYTPNGRINSYDCFYVREPPKGCPCPDATTWRETWLGAWTNYVSCETDEGRTNSALASSTARVRYHLINGEHFTYNNSENVESLGKTVHGALIDRETALIRI